MKKSAMKGCIEDFSRIALRDIRMGRADQAGEAATVAARFARSLYPRLRELPETLKPFPIYKGLPTDSSLQAKTTPEALATLRSLAASAHEQREENIELVGPEAVVRFLVWLTPELVLHLLNKAESAGGLVVQS